MEAKQWEIVEFRSGLDIGLMYLGQPDGHDVYVTAKEREFVVTQPLENDDHLMGSFIGAHVAVVPVAHGEAGRAVALKNARLIAAAPELLALLVDVIGDFPRGVESNAVNAARAFIQAVR